ncbi:hypothetical protein JX266_012184 [Neoarthrinium moseri]|nr:hypothetical protein JX266_012184 [Neoarthrinium moseri]
MPPKQEQGQSADKSRKRPADGPLASSQYKKPKTQGGKPKPHTSADAGNNKPAASAQGAAAGKAKFPQNSKDGRSQSNKSDKAPGTAKDGQSSRREPSRPFMKMRDIRAIAAQSSDAALKDGELDVQSFLNARGFEIKALDESMRRTRGSNMSRAFQKVPFTMRRRAAAHNHKRVPKRLQRRAKREMEVDNTPTVNSKTRKPKTTRSRLRAETARRLGKLAERKRKQKLLKQGKDGKLDEITVTTRLARPKIRRNALNDPIVTAKKFRKRQKDKTWLPTHLWHTKRARMTPPKEPMWRFAIPLTPNQKCYRPTHRAQWEKGAIAWDMSYMSTISLCGTEGSVSHVLKAVGLKAESLWNEKGKRWRSGAVHWTGMLSMQMDGVSKTTGPGAVIWNPEPASSDETPNSEKTVWRKLFIRLHPSMFLDTFNNLVRLAKGLSPRPYVEDLRYEVGSIDITGPDATEALLGVLKPYPFAPDAQEPHASRFGYLAGSSGPAVLPAGSLLAFSVMDPRLLHQARRTQKPAETQQADHASFHQALLAWHKDTTLKPIDLFDRDARFKACQLPSQKSINRRKGKKAPGASLEPTKADPHIPIILLASRQSNTTGTWTVLMPWKCVLPIWYTLMHYPLTSGGNPSFGGLNEIRQLAFEQSAPWFPGDFPATKAGSAWELQERDVRRKAWERMPKGKRVNYKTLDLGAGRQGEIGEGWSCDYERLMSLDSLPATEQQDVEMKDQEDHPPASGGEPNQAASRTELLSRLSHLSKSAMNTHLRSAAGTPPPTSLVTVKITYLGRGVPGACARIYRLPTRTTAISTQAEVPASDPPPSKSSGLPSDLREQWLETLPRKGKQAQGKPGLKHNTSTDVNLETRKRLLAQELITPTQPLRNGEGINGHLLCPNPDDLIGFVTSGSFNLRSGRPEAIGSLEGQKALEELKRYKDKGDRASRICVVRNAGQNIGWIGKWELV